MSFFSPLAMPQNSSDMVKVVQAVSVLDNAAKRTAPGRADMLAWLGQSLETCPHFHNRHIFDAIEIIGEKDANPYVARVLWDALLAKIQTATPEERAQATAGWRNYLAKVILRYLVEHSYDVTPHTAPDHLDTLLLTDALPDFLLECASQSGKTGTRTIANVAPSFTDLLIAHLHAAPRTAIPPQGDDRSFSLLPFIKTLGINIDDTKMDLDRKASLLAALSFAHSQVQREMTFPSFFAPTRHHTAVCHLVLQPGLASLQETPAALMTAHQKIGFHAALEDLTGLEKALIAIGLTLNEYTRTCVRLQTGLPFQKKRIKAFLHAIDAPKAFTLTAR